MTTARPATVASYIAIFIIAALAGCASAPPEPTVDYKQDYNFSTVKTFAFLPQSGGTSGDSPKMFLSDMQKDRIDEALKQAVEQKGIKYINDPARADVLLTWHLSAQEKTDVRTYSTGASYGGGYGGGYYGGSNRRAHYNCWNCGGTEVSVRQYTQGTFIVDVVDPGMDQSVWRSVIQSKLKGEMGQDQQVYTEAANRIMARFPPIQLTQ